jgi:hypothetical protein
VLKAVNGFNYAVQCPTYYDGNSKMPDVVYPTGFDVNSASDYQQQHTTN